MRWSCRRPGCGREAQVAITYDAVACQVWLDPIDVAPGGAQPLCPEHAQRLSPPRGWVVLDRRDSQASLLTVSPPLVEQAGRRGVARRRFPRRWGQFDEPRLEFVGPDRSHPEAEHEPRPESEPESESESESEVESPPDAERESASESPADGEATRDESSPARGEQQELTKLLKPKGRLLSRAFDLTGDQRSVLTDAGRAVPPEDEPAADG